MSGTTYNRFHQLQREIIFAFNLFLVTIRDMAAGLEVYM